MCGSSSSVIWILGGIHKVLLLHTCPTMSRWPSIDAPPWGVDGTINTMTLLSVWSTEYEGDVSSLDWNCCSTILSIELVDDTTFPFSSHARPTFVVVWCHRPYEIDSSTCDSHILTEGVVPPTRMFLFLYSLSDETRWMWGLLPYQAIDPLGFLLPQPIPILVNNLCYRTRGQKNQSLAPPVPCWGWHITTHIVVHIYKLSLSVYIIAGL